MLSVLGINRENRVTNPREEGNAESLVGVGAFCKAMVFSREGFSHPNEIRYLLELGFPIAVRVRSVTGP